MNGLGKTLRKNRSKKSKKKTVKIKVKLPHVNKKKPQENSFSNTVFSHYFKTKAKNFTSKNHSLFDTLS